MRNNTLVSRISILFFSLLLALPAWAEKQRADLSRLVVVGDSLSAGFQNGSLLETQQPHGYASLVAAQAGVPLALPLVATPGFPPILVNPGPPPTLVRLPVTALPVRTNPTVQPFNVAVPGHNVQDALTTRPTQNPATGQQILDTLVLGIPGLAVGISRSQVEWAEALHPTTIILWIGNNDALGAATAADASLLTKVSDFEAAYGEVIDRLAATGATLVVANIPDVTVVPFLTRAEDVAAQLGVPPAALGLAAGDFVTPDAFGRIAAGEVPLAADVVLDAREVAEIRAAIDAYNAFIAKKAKQHGAALVDIHRTLARIQKRGVVIGGQRLTTAFLGGLFSLDGIHPTNTGYAVIANRFIRALNRKFDADIRRVSLVKVKNDDPLVLPDTGRPARHGHISPETARSMRDLMTK